MSARIAVAVSGAGSNLRALHAAAVRGELGGDIVLVVADRTCPAADWASEQGIDTAVVPGGADDPLAEALAGARADVVVLAGYMRIVGPAVLAAFPGRILNTHPSLLPAFPGGHAVRDALAHGARVTGATVHLVDETLDGGPIVSQEAVAVLAGDDEASLHARIRAIEHRILPHAVALLLAGAVTGPAAGERTTTIGIERAEATLPTPRRALLSVSDKAGLVDFARGLVDARFELVSTGGTARALRDAGLPVTDVAAVTGAAEMLDGRVKTLHPRVHAGILADRRLVDHRRQLVAAAIAPFELVVVNLYPFAAAADRPGITFDELVEEIDIGGPSMVRAAAKNHASVAIVTSPARYPHQPAARYRRPDGHAVAGPFATGHPPLQGKALSYNNVLDGSAAAGIARALRGPACVIVKHTNPCGAAERETIREAWDAALAGDPVSAFGGVVALTRTVDRATADGLASLFLEVVVAPGYDDTARAVLAAKGNLRLLVDPTLADDGPPPTPDPLGSIRSAGGAILVTAPDTAPDDPSTWQVATRRPPTDTERADLDLAWRLARGVTSNAIVLVRDGRQIGFGSGQTSRVDAARQAVDKARAIAGPDSLIGAACASDAFYPFPDAIEACLEAGVTAFVQPGGSKNDAVAVAAVDAAGGAMLLTGVRHFRH